MDEGERGQKKAGGWPARERIMFPTRLRPEQLEGLKRVSERQDLSVTALIRRGVDLVLAEAGEAR